MSPSKPSRIYTVGWICALRIERNASKCFSDEIHDDVQPPQVDVDDVSYSFGEINGHNIVMAVLPMDEYGTATAGLVATNMLRSFPDIRIALLVGIGGGAPYRDRDIRLGDVVVSTRVVQHDYGKRIQGKGFQVTGQLDRPPQSLRSAIQTLQDRYDDSEDGNGIDAQISRVLDQYPRRAKVHSRPVTKDVLYATNVLHPDPHQSCDAVCAQGRLVDRPRRDEKYDDICAIHYGLIASGNTVLKDAEMRDLQAQYEQVLCFEMEAAGLMNTNFKCLVIRGICDYCDTHKNKDWQGYAAMAAAAYASDLLRCLPPRLVENESTMDVGRMLEQIQTGITKLQETHTTVLSSLDHRRDEEVLKWLDEVNYELHQSDIFERRQKGTSQWLIDHEHFQTWIKSKGKILFCPGIPGAGKTTMTSAIVDHLLSSFRSDTSVGIAYIYCSFRLRESQKTKHILANIAKQLAARKSRLPRTIQELFDRKKTSRPSLEDVIPVLHELISHFERTFIVVDGLDECQDSAWNGFLNEIISWTSRSAVNIFATSRYIKEIEVRFRGSLLLPIRATGSDVTKFLEGVIENDPGLGLKDPVAVTSIKKRMVHDIVEASNGMFLLAKIYIDLIRRMSTKRDILEKLNQFRRHKPGAAEGDKVQCLQAAYKETMERIRASETWLLARNALIWVAFSEWPLSTVEICHALAVRDCDTELDEDGIPSINAVIAACSGLITTEEESEIIRLTHFTVKEYLDLAREDWFTDPHSHIAGTCCKYLLFDKVISDWPSNQFRTLEARKEAFPLGLFAVRCWGQHAGQAKSLPDSLMQFIFSKSALPAAFFLSIKRPIEDHEDPSGDISQHGAINIALRISALHGIRLALQRMINDGHSAKFDTRQLDLALQEAAYWGHESTVQLLLDTGSNLNARPGPVGTALQAASAHGHLGIIELLLGYDRAMPISPATVGSALYAASENDHVQALGTLLSNGAEVNGCWVKGRTALQAASYWGHERVVHLLLAHGADPNLRLGSETTPLQAASERGHENVVRKLLAAGAKISGEPGPRGTAVQVACRTNGVSLVKMLLSSAEEAGPEVLRLVETELGQTNGLDDIPIAKQVVNSGWSAMAALVLPHSTDNERKCLFHYAAGLEGQVWESKVEKMVPILRKNGIDINAIDPTGVTAIEIALRRSGVKLAQVLVDNGATIPDSVIDLATSSGIVAKQQLSAKLSAKSNPDSLSSSSETDSGSQVSFDSEASSSEWVESQRPSKRPRLGSRGSVLEPDLPAEDND